MKFEVSFKKAQKTRKVSIVAPDLQSACRWGEKQAKIWDTKLFKVEPTGEQD